MKIIRIFSALLLVAFVVSSCKKEPVACFSVNNLTWDEGDTLQLFVGDTITVNAACTGDAESYNWSSVGLGGYIFGNGNTVVEKYTFTDPGEYKVSLTVKNGKKSDQKTLPILVQ
jgi:PKD repeat protein